MVRSERPRASSACLSAYDITGCSHHTKAQVYPATYVRAATAQHTTTLNRNFRTTNDSRSESVDGVQLIFCLPGDVSGDLFRRVHRVDKARSFSHEHLGHLEWIATIACQQNTKSLTHMLIRFTPTPSSHQTPSPPTTLSSLADKPLFFGKVSLSHPKVSLFPTDKPLSTTDKPLSHTPTNFSLPPKSVSLSRRKVQASLSHR